jgi:ketosteroid isomerase-like protein
MHSSSTKERKEFEMGSDTELVLAAIKAVEERDAARLFELYADDVEFHDAPSLPYGGVVNGKEALAEMVGCTPEGTWLGTWGPVQPTDGERRMDPEVIGEKDGEVVVLYRQRAVAPDGERFDAPVVGLYQVRDGRLARAQMFHYDTAAIEAFLARARLASEAEDLSRTPFRQEEDE